MTPRALLLALGSVAGVLFGRALDGLGVLPGVHESAAVKAVALSPAWTAAGVVTCLLLGALVDRVRHRGLAALLLVGGQVLVLAAPEIAGRSGPHEGGEAPLWTAIAVQLLLSLLTLTTVVLVRRTLLPQPGRLPALPGRGSAPGAWLPPVLSRRRAGGLGGRAPPDGPAPAFLPSPS